MSASADWLRSEGPSADPYAEWDAAYVLGALPPSERLEFEGHLALCPRCGASVAEIAGLPGLLAQVGPEDAAALTEIPAQQDGPPPTVLPEVLATVRQERGRLTKLLLGLAAAVTLVLAGLGLGQLLDLAGRDEPQRLAFAAVERSYITANVTLVPVSSGTDVHVECQYSGARDPDPRGHYAEYSVVVTDRSGRASTIKDWPISANKVMRPSGTTPLKVSQIGTVEIRETATNETVLRAEPVR
jgi:hypothetical protein